MRNLFAQATATPLRKRIFHGTISNLFGAAVIKMLGMVTYIWLARKLGKIAFGELATIQSTVLLFATFANLGLAVTATKYIAEFRGTDSQRVGRIIGLSEVLTFVCGSMAAVALVCAGPWLASHVLSAPQLGAHLQWGALLLICNLFIWLDTAILTGFESFWRLAWIGIVVGIINLPLMVGGSLLAGLNGAYAGLILSSVANIVLLRLAVRCQARRSKVRISYRKCWQEKKILLHFSLPAFLTSMVADPVGWVTSTLLVNQAGGYAERGLLGITSTWSNFITFVPSAMNRIMVPILSERFGHGDRHSLRKVYLFNAVFASGIALVVSLPVMLGATMILRLYGDDFTGAHGLLILTSVSSVLVVLVSSLKSGLTGGGKMWPILWITMVQAVVVVSLSFWLIPGHKAMGLACAELAGFALIAIAYTIYSIRLVR